ncbi:helix-turn-helix transcriptional regulator [Methylobacterium sp. C25]|uniref:helix-turn-helix domain-containing protein n=1 Tax=Methylobacterium sp. C25 TaxID=2721622 RepID=UPI001F1CE47A|nr:helix-turn-helix transcriptional regulator [Methylobacterium sp. C25]MCE4226183.1 helix-turn-helix transcriptional regulator [Methylobacterium sp. C25]
MPKTLHSGRHRKLVDTLVEYRERSGITQSELAVRLGRYQSTVAVMEGGSRRIDLVELLALAEALEFDIHELIERVRAVPQT